MTTATTTGVQTGGAIVQSIARNTSIMLGQYFITATSTFILTLFLPRYLGPVEYGRLFLAMQVVAIFRVLVEYGGSYLVAKNVSRTPDQAGQIVMDAATFRMLVAVVAFLGVIELARVLGYSFEQQLLIFIVGIGLFWKGGMTVLVAFFQGLEQMRYSSVAAITEAVFMTVVGILALLLGAKALEIAVISVISSFLNFCVLAWNSKKKIRILPKVNWKDLSGQIKLGASYFLFAVFATIYYRIDSLMLSKMAPVTVVGWYGGAYRLFDVLNFFPVIFSTAVYPVLSRLWNEEEGRHKVTTQRSMEFMILLGIPVTIGAIAFAGNAVDILYGLPAYAPSIQTLRVLALGITFLFIDMTIGTTLIASDKQRHQSILALCAIPFNVGLNFVFIPYTQVHFGNGGIGAGLATVLTEFFIMTSGLALLPKGILKGFRTSVVLKTLAAGGTMALFLLGAERLGIPWYLNAAVCPFLYGSVLILLRTFEPSERNLLLSLFRFRTLATMLTGKTDR